jgi:hypothetical protein
VYQVSVDSPEPVDITELQVGMETNKLVLVASINGSINSDEAWSVRVPNGMISDINAVTLEGAEDNTGNATLEFTVDTSNPDYSVIAFTPDETGEQTMRISIIGSSVMPEFPASYALSIVAVISAIVASLVVRRRSS